MTSSTVTHKKEALKKSDLLAGHFCFKPVTGWSEVKEMFSL